ncbi:MAG: transcriptional regulator, MarR family [Ramlibacter sp.]|jgi:DNA-binding MarR family transcriptional regulator|nr:transcriptional regulator, MarR family [Ramlibacter sp.]
MSAVRKAAPPKIVAKGAPVPPPARVLRRFRVVFNAVKNHFREVEKKAGVAGAQLWALSVVHDCPGIGVSDLARAMDVHQSTASNLVRSLIERNMVEVRKDATDRRTVQLHLLPAGAKVLRRAPGPFAGVLPEALAALDAQTLSRLDKDLGTLIDALGVDKHDAGIPLGQP